MYKNKMNNIMDQTLFACLIFMTSLFFTIEIQHPYLDIELHSTPKNALEYDYNKLSPEKNITNISFISKEDLQYLKYYDSSDALFILRYSVIYQIPIVYLYRQDYIESKLGKRTINRRKYGMDVGFKQLNSEYLDYYVDKYYILNEPFDPMNHEHSIQVGCAYLRDLYEQFFCDWRLAFEAYNAGPTKVKSFNVPPISKQYAQCILNGYSKEYDLIEVSSRGMK